MKYALNSQEVKTILKDKECHVKVDSKERKDPGFPVGVMDVISIEKSGENFRLLYDVKGRWTLVDVKSEEAKFKLCRIKKKMTASNKIPYIVTNDGRTIRYPHPSIEANDTVKLDIVNNKIVDHVKLTQGNVVYITSGNNVGRVGVLVNRDVHQGSFDICHVRDSTGNTFATRVGNVFVIGKGKKPWVSLPKQDGIYKTPLELKKEQDAAVKK